MSYNVSMKIEDLSIPKDKVKGALEDQYKLRLRQKGDISLYWVRAGFLAMVKDLLEDGSDHTLFATALIDILEYWRYEAKLTAEGDVQILRFNSTKLEDDEVLWNNLAPYLTDGAIWCKGEGEDLWVWEFKGGVMEEKWGTVVYE